MGERGAGVFILNMFFIPSHDSMSTQVLFLGLFCQEVSLSAMSHGHQPIGTGSFVSPLGCSQEAGVSYCVTRLPLSPWVGPSFHLLPR